MRDRRMTLALVRDLLGANVWCATDLSVPVDSVMAADLMSDVLTTGGPGMVLLTGLASVQTVRAAAIADLVGVVFVAGKTPPDDVVLLAREKMVPVMSTSMSMFQAAGLLYRAVHAEPESSVVR
jgi:predicted transcriptional regulator